MLKGFYIGWNTIIEKIVYFRNMEIQRKHRYLEIIAFVMQYFPP